MDKKKISAIIAAVITAAISILYSLGYLSSDDAEKAKDKVEQVTSE